VRVRRLESEGMPPKPVDISQEQRELILRVLLDGGTVKKALQLVGISRFSFYQLKGRDPAFAVEVDRAQAEGIEAALDNHGEELEDHKGDNLRSGDARLLRIKGDHVRWLASRLKRDKYGDRVEVQVTMPDVAGAIAAARSRAVVQVEGHHYDVSCAAPPRITDESDEEEEA